MGLILTSDISSEKSFMSASEIEKDPASIKLKSIENISTYTLLNPKPDRKNKKQDDKDSSRATYNFKFIDPTFTPTFAGLLAAKKMAGYSAKVFITPKNNVATYYPGLCNSVHGFLMKEYIPGLNGFDVIQKSYYLFCKYKARNSDNTWRFISDLADASVQPELLMRAKKHGTSSATELDSLNSDQFAKFVEYFDAKNSIVKDLPETILHFDSYAQAMKCIEIESVHPVQQIINHLEKGKSAPFLRFVSEMSKLNYNHPAEVSNFINSQNSALIMNDNRLIDTERNKIDKDRFESLNFTVPLDYSILSKQRKHTKQPNIKLLRRLLFEKENLYVSLLLIKRQIKETTNNMVFDTE